jgi:ADP-heptose:LPS heptosyltransferase
MKIVDMAPLLEDFQSTAEIINSLDLIITVDSAVLHLAGAMGKKAYGLLSWNNDWRWKSEGNESIWYSSIKLFRQKKLGEWDYVFNIIEEELKNEFKIK